ncbi:MAG: hypothetical protein ACTSRA_00605 [Promethearchaeota archaeon]
MNLRKLKILYQKELMKASSLRRRSIIEYEYPTILNILKKEKRVKKGVPVSQET